MLGLLKEKYLNKSEFGDENLASNQEEGFCNASETIVTRYLLFIFFWERVVGGDESSNSATHFLILSEFVLHIFIYLSPLQSGQISSSHILLISISVEY